MNLKTPTILVITPIKHIAGVSGILESIGQVTYMDDPSLSEVVACIAKYDAIYTNPNKTKAYIGKEVIDAAKKLKVICTASTGTNHIDKVYAAERGLAILALTEERHIIESISSTAELAFALTLSSLRHVVKGHNATLHGEWDYTKYIGRQMNSLTVGVIGYGRLGSMYAGYCKSLGSRVLVFDPYKTVDKDDLEQVGDLKELLASCDVISLHVHVNDETFGMVDNELLSHMRDDVILVNTSRGDIVNERDLVVFLTEKPKARVATDVLANEVLNRIASPLLHYAAISNQVIITPHIGGMTREAQEIAYRHAARMLKSFLEGARYFV